MRPGRNFSVGDRWRNYPKSWGYHGPKRTVENSLTPSYKRYSFPPVNHAHRHFSELRNYEDPLRHLRTFPKHPNKMKPERRNGKNDKDVKAKETKPKKQGALYGRTTPVNEESDADSSNSQYWILHSHPGCEEENGGVASSVKKTVRRQESTPVNDESDADSSSSQYWMLHSHPGCDAENDRVQRSGKKKVGGQKGASANKERKADNEDIQRWMIHSHPDCDEENGGVLRSVKKEVGGQGGGNEKESADKNNENVRKLGKEAPAKRGENVGILRSVKEEAVREGDESEKVGENQCCSKEGFKNGSTQTFNCSFADAATQTSNSEEENVSQECRYPLRNRNNGTPNAKRGRKNCK